MTRKLLTYIIFAIALCFAPALSNTASARMELSEIDNASPCIEQNGNALIISNAAGKSLHIYNVIGVEVTDPIRIDTNDKKVELTTLKKGVYLVKVGNISKKIHIQGR